MDQRAGQGNALLHPPRQLRRECFREPIQADQGDGLICAPGDIWPLGSRDLERKRDVGTHGAPGHQIGALKDVSDLPLRLRERPPAQQDAARDGPDQPGQEPQQRALAAPRRPHDREELALFHRKG